MAKAEYRSAQRSRRMIHAALAELMKEKPLDKITVTDVVKRADLNRGTFYAHYTDIRDVLEHQLEDASNVLISALQERERNASVQPDPSVVLHQIESFFEENIEMYTSILNSSIGGDCMERIRNVFINYMLEHETEFSVKDHERYLVNIMFASGGVASMYQDWVAGKIPLTLSQLTDCAIAINRDIMC